MSMVKKRVDLIYKVYFLGGYFQKEYNQIIKLRRSYKKRGNIKDVIKDITN